MRENLKYNITNYLKTDSKIQVILMFVIIVLSTILMLISFTLSIYSVETINAQTECNKEICTLHFFEMNATKEKYDFVKIKSKKYEIENINYAEASLDAANNIIQELSLKLENYQGNHNEIIELNLYKNKEKILKKIVKIILER